MGLKEIIGTTILRYIGKKESEEKDRNYNDELGFGAVCDVNFLRRLRTRVNYDSKSCHYKMLRKVFKEN